MSQGRIQDPRRLQKPSLTLTKYASQIAQLAPGPILDVPCGYGRNARLMSLLGCTVVCLDKATAALQAILDDSFSLWPPSKFKQRSESAGSLIPIFSDLAIDSWPFAPDTFGAVINIHFILPRLFDYFELSLRPGGYLLFETFSGRGGNYLELPRAGELREKLKGAFDLELYAERAAGPPGQDAVTVKLLGRKKPIPLSYHKKKRMEMGPDSLSPLADRFRPGQRFSVAT